MKCFKCGAEAPAGNKFCPHCGASMSVGQSAGGMGQNQANPGLGQGAPQMQNPGQQNVGYQNPGYQNPGYQNPGYQNPGYQNTGYQNPGYPKADYQNPGYPVPGNTANSMATASMILGIVGDVVLVIAIFIGASSEYKVLGIRTEVYNESTMGMAIAIEFIGLICTLIGFVLAICSLRKKTTKKGRAITGLICSGIIIVPVILGLLIMGF